MHWHVGSSLHCDLSQLANTLTVGVRLLERIPCINKTGGTVVLILQLHVETCCFAKRISSSLNQGRESTITIRKMSTFLLLHMQQFAIVPQTNGILAYKASEMWEWIYLYRELVAPLQFFAILNMLAALQYISHASSTLWCPLERQKREIWWTQ